MIGGIGVGLIINQARISNRKSNLEFIAYHQEIKEWIGNKTFQLEAGPLSTIIGILALPIFGHLSWVKTCPESSPVLSQGVDHLKKQIVNPVDMDE